MCLLLNEISQRDIHFLEQEHIFERYHHHQAMQMPILDQLENYLGTL